MIGRPCRPDADFRRLWRTLMPDMPLPACGVSDQSDTEPAGEQLAETDDGAPRHVPTSLLGSLQAWLNRPRSRA
jgi:hypothetical protein